MTLLRWPVVLHWVGGLDVEVFLAEGFLEGLLTLM